MADAYKTLYQGQVPNVAAALYTVPAGKSAIMKHYSAVNPTGGAVTLKLYRNGTDDAHLVLPSLSIPAGGHATDDMTWGLEAGGYIAGVAGAATSITLTLDGDEVT
jgi:hypothetical protein